MPTRSRSIPSSGGGGGGPLPNAGAADPAPATEATAADVATAAAGEPDAPAAAIDLGDRSLYINRELSMLAFQRRVLEEAQDERNPLLERVKFLSILGSNLGEFFMVRVAGLRQQVEAGVADLSSDGMTPAEQLVACREQAYELMREARDTWASVIMPQLTAAGIQIHDFAGLDEGQRAAAIAYFDRSAFPVLTPLAFDPGRPFPHISNMSLNLAVLLRDEHGQQLFARVKVPSSLPRLVIVPPPADLPAAAKTRRYDFVWLEQLIAADLDELFPGMAIVGVYTFRVTRDAEMSIQELEADDLLETIEQGVLRRRFGSVVRLTIEASTPDDVRHILLDNLDLEPEGLVAVRAPLGMSGINLLRSRPARPQRPAVRAGRAAGLGRPRPQRLCRDSQARHPHPSPLRLVRAGHRLARKRGPRPRRAGHQDDALPGGAQRPGGRGAARGGPQRQRGRRAGRAQGALRRGVQHRVGAGARRRGRARRLRPRRPEDALQDRHGRAPRGRRHQTLRAPRHRQLQRGDRPPLHRPRPVHLRRDHRRRTPPSSSTSSPASRGRATTRSSWSARSTCASASRPCSSARSNTSAPAAAATSSSR
jgi:hypothetical protein